MDGSYDGAVLEILRCVVLSCGYILTGSVAEKMLNCLRQLVLNIGGEFSLLLFTHFSHDIGALQHFINLFTAIVSGRKLRLDCT